jgi:hypothetical protein
MVRSGLASAAAFVGFLATSFIGLLVAADAVMYLIPREGCDSGCWNNTALMRVLGIAGLLLGAALVASTPVAVAYAKRHAYRRTALFLGVVAVAVIAWVPWTNSLLAAKAGGGGLNLLP